MREYEACFVIHPRVDEAGIEKEIGAVTDTIASGSGELVGVHKWGRRKMAYTVQNVRDGFYVLARFNGEPGLLTELDRRFKLNENVLRHLVVRSVGDEFPPDLRAREPRRGPRGDGSRGDGPRGDGHRGDGHRGDGPRGDGPRGDGPRGDGPRGDGPRGDGPRGDGHRGDGPRGDGPARGRRRDDGGDARETAGDEAAQPATAKPEGVAAEGAPAQAEKSTPPPTETKAPVEGAPAETTETAAAAGTGATSETKAAAEADESKPAADPGDGAGEASSAERKTD